MEEVLFVVAALLWGVLLAGLVIPYNLWVLHKAPPLFLRLLAGHYVAAVLGGGVIGGSYVVRALGYEGEWPCAVFVLIWVPALLSTVIWVLFRSKRFSDSP